VKQQLQIAALLLAGALVGSLLTVASYNRYTFDTIGDRGYFVVVTDRWTGATVLHRLYYETVVTTDLRNGSQREYRTVSRFRR
jgi:hypothetical protein